MFEGSNPSLSASLCCVQLDIHTAAVELINILRPTIAIARYATFAALALHEYPQSRQKLQNNGEDYCEWFVQEVRIFYLFFSFAAAIVGRNFDWHESDKYTGGEVAEISSRPDVTEPELISTPSIAPSGLAFYSSDRCLDALPKASCADMRSGYTTRVQARLAYAGETPARFLAQCAKRSRQAGCLYAKRYP